MLSSMHHISMSYALKEVIFEDNLYIKVSLSIIGKRMYLFGMSLSLEIGE